MSMTTVTADALMIHFNTTKQARAPGTKVEIGAE